MPTIPVDAVSGQSLLLKHIGADDFSVQVETDDRQLQAGRMMAVQRGFVSPAWFSTIIDPAVTGSTN
jgi:hypothetical protein